MRFLCCGLMSPPPERPCDDVGGLNSFLRETLGYAADFLDRPTDEASRIVRPALRQIERPIDEGMAVTRHVGSKNTDLTVRNLPAEPVYCRATPHDALPCLRNPVSSITSEHPGETHALATMTERIPAPVAQGCNHPRRGQAVRSEPPARIRERKRRDEKDPANEDKPAGDRKR